jgi:hypothetical protein
VGISAETLRLLMEAGLSGDDLLEVVSSIDRDMAQAQPKQTSNAARQARYRERKALRCDVTSNVTQTVTENVTSPRARVEDITTNLKPEQKNKKEEGANRNAPKKRATRIGDYLPDVATATGMGIPEPRAKREADKFVDWALSAPGDRGVKLDWPATWRNWCRRVADDLGATHTTGPPEKVFRFKTYDEVSAEMEAESAGRTRTEDLLGEPRAGADFREEAAPQSSFPARSAPPEVRQAGMGSDPRMVALIGQTSRALAFPR